MSNEIIEVSAKFSSVVFNGRDGFQIVSFIPVNEDSHKVSVHPTYNNFSVKGNFPSMRKGEEYVLSMTESYHPKHGKGYELQFMKSTKTVNFKDKKSFKDFLTMVTTSNNADNIIATLDNAEDVFNEGNIEELCKVKGVGTVTAMRLIENYEAHKDYSQAYIEIGKYGIDAKIIKKIVDFTKSNEKAIEVVEKNPYLLMDISGYGFSKCDEIFLKVNEDFYNSEFRIKAYIRHVMKVNAYSDGHTWMDVTNFITKVSSDINVTKKEVAIMVNEMTTEGDTIILYKDSAKPRIAHKFLYEKELSATDNIFRILFGENNFDNTGLSESIEKTESNQGWEFTGEQKEGINVLAEKKVVLLEGLAGTGKSTVLKTIVDFYTSKNYTFVQTALSGKASNNLALITGAEGFTIHRLLMVDPSTGKFYYNENRKLPHDLIIIDELSMVDVVIAEALLKAMKDSAKLIMIGDSEQLEAIGIQFMKPLIESKIIPRIMLTQIHRQAEKSAMVTHSIKVRKGEIPIEEKRGTHTYGELQDLTYDLVDEDSSINISVLKQFKKLLNDGEDIMDVQMLSAMKTGGNGDCLTLNKMAQKIYNPNVMLEKVTIKNDGGEYDIKLGDKVINVKNNNSTQTVNGTEKPIYNGSVGIVTGFQDVWDKDKKTHHMIIEFEGANEEIMISQEDYRNIELAYCITIHKAQGMGVKHVIIAYAYSYMLNSRQSFYTAMTRARLTCYIVSMHSTIKHAVSKDATRRKRTFLTELIVSSARAIYNAMKERRKVEVEKEVS